MGTIKNAVYKVDNGVDFDEIHFKTKASQVFCNDGKTVESQLADMMNGTVMVKKSINAHNLTEELIALPATTEVNKFKIWLPNEEEVLISIYGYFNVDNSIAIREGAVSTNSYNWSSISKGVVTGAGADSHWGMVMGSVYAGTNVINIRARRYSQKLYIDGTIVDGKRNALFSGVGDITVGKGSEIELTLFAVHSSTIYARASYKVKKEV